MMLGHIFRLPGEERSLSGTDAPAWRRFARIFGGVLIACLAPIFTAIVVLDPYDSGRFPTFMPGGVSDENQQTANASRGRDPRFNAAIFGNSHAQLIDPRELSTATGLSFVQLTTPGSGPREQVATLRYFLRHHPRVDAAVLSLDERWCERDPSMPVLFPFPFWLYRSDLEYLGHILSSRSISAARKRIRLARGELPPTDPVGYWDYETGHAWNFRPAPVAREPVDLSPRRIADPSFPALDYIADAISELPSRTRVVLIMPPQFAGRLPERGSAAAVDLAGCKHEVMDWAARHPSATFLDFLLDTPATRDPANFMDAHHYRHNVARLLESGIAESIRVRVVTAADRADESR